MSIRLKTLLAAAIFFTTAVSHAADKFTLAEQQQISIATPGLFDKSNAFTIDFASLGKTDFSFPLPVGKPKVQPDGDLQISTKKGDAVKAMFDGTVRLSRNNPVYGNVIVVRHDNGLETVYSHNAQNLVKVGQRVKAGQTIAIVGGDDGQTFCDVSIMVNGGKINPNTILNVRRRSLRPQMVLCRKNGANVDISIMRDGKAQPAATTTEEEEVFTEPFANGNEYKLDLAGMNPGEWSYPLPGAKVISPYGGRRRHSGVDIKTVPNDEVLAAFDGTVTMAKPYFGYGNCIVIKHDNGLETLYSHQSKNMVKVGDRVKAGQVIGLTGRTGRATTEHLHFEVHIKGKRFNPAIIFDHLNNSLKQEMVVFTKRGNSVTIKSQKTYYAQGKKGNTL